MPKMALPKASELIKWQSPVWKLILLQIIPPSTIYILWFEKIIKGSFIIKSYPISQMFLNVYLSNFIISVNSS